MAKRNNPVKTVREKNINSTSQDVLSLLLSRKSLYWEEKGNAKVLGLFQEAAKRVPAYKDFLNKNKVRTGLVKKIADFKNIPPVTKDNYLRQYPLKDLCWDGRVDQSGLVFTATSGTTGGPIYFPRDEAIDWQSSVLHELFLTRGDKNGKKSTLVIVCFGMGVWIGGIITYQAFRKIGERGYPLAIITPGINKEEIFNAVKNIGPSFERIILCGYPPFIKDIIDEGQVRGIKWHKFQELKIVFAAETFSEKFRDYIARKAGIKNPYLDTMNIYGSADLGTMAEETPLSIFIRKQSVKNKELHSALFQNAGSRLPTLVQFNPDFDYIEEDEGIILITSYNHLPLIRYSIGDRGGVVSFSSAVQILKKSGIGLDMVQKETGYRHISELPFVYVYERLDFSTKLYGAIIYTEHVRDALHARLFEKFITGKFCMSTRFDSKQNQFLEVDIELKPNMAVNKRAEKKILDEIIKHLLEKNAEYRNNFMSMKEKVTPHLFFRSYSDPEYFKPGIKQKWVKKQ